MTAKFYNNNGTIKTYVNWSKFLSYAHYGHFKNYAHVDIIVIDKLQDGGAKIRFYLPNGYLEVFFADNNVAISTLHNGFYRFRGYNRKDYGGNRVVLSSYT